MKRILSFLFALLLCLPPITALAVAENEAPTSLSAECAALLEADGKRLLYGKNADKRHAMASTTKIMTALVALRHMSLSTVITVPKEAVGVEGSSVYLKEGERYTLEALLYALLLQSANDAAEVIAYAVAGGISQFADLMNEEATALGLNDTHFANPHGLDAEDHYTTARELALLTCEALEDSDLAAIVASRRYVFASVDGSNPRTLINHNKLLVLYDGAIGVKTGYTKRCGRCLASAAERDGLRLVAVTLDAPSDWNDHRLLLDYGFSTYESRLLAPAGTLTVSLPLFNQEGTARAHNRDDIRFVLRRDAETPTPSFEVLPFPTAPLFAGSYAGTVSFSEDGYTVTAPLVFSEDIPLNKKHKG